MRLSDFEALSFDCYGTLIDWETGILAALAPWRARTGVGIDDTALLAAFARHESARQQATPGLHYSELLTRVAEALGREFGAPPTAEEARAFGGSVPDWPAFADSAPALAYLRRHFMLIVLSNVDEASFQGSAKRLGEPFTAALTAEAIGSYKPDPRNFSHLLEWAGAGGVPREKLLHVAESLYHDHVPAKAVGLRTAWIHRRHAKGGFGATTAPAVEVTPDFRFTSLGDLAEAHRREAAGG
jgi:2-haloalkanoic acid dehalogenase type II